MNHDQDTFGNWDCDLGGYRRRRGFLVPDDFQAGMYVAIDSQTETDQPVVDGGWAFRVIAHHRTWVLGERVIDRRLFVLDTRVWNLVEVPQEFARAQTLPGVPYPGI
jgi:hypothetical protein